jgi:hypothetical protein
MNHFPLLDFLPAEYIRQNSRLSEYSDNGGFRHPTTSNDVLHTNSSDGPKISKEGFQRKLTPAKCLF